MDFEDALAYVQGRLRLGIKLGNERFEALLERLGSPHRTLKVVHVAGTKGKGSTTAMIGGILQGAGYKTGVYLSPYVYDVRERVQIDGQLIAREDFASLVTEIQPHVEALERTDLGATTEFELKTAIGLLHFARQKVDFAVIEVGLGGRLDATNVVRDPLVSVITNIGYDHVEMLGPTLAHIAREKAGIVKRGVPCVTGVPVGGEADVEIAAICRDRSAKLIHVVPGGASEWTFEDGAGNAVRIQTPRRTIDAHLGLHGRFQHANAAVAVAALDAVDPVRLPPIADEIVRTALANTTLPGRFRQVSDKPVVIVDVAHNELSASALANALREEYQADDKRLVFVVGLSKTHDPEPFLRPLAELKPALLIATEPRFRPRDAAEVAEAANALGVENIAVCADHALTALEQALALQPAADVICLTGSFYTVGDAPPDRIATLLQRRN